MEKKGGGLDFAALFREHVAGVLASVRRFSVPPWNAEDVTQDVFVKILKALDRDDPSQWVRGPSEAWEAP